MRRIHLSAILLIAAILWGSLLIIGGVAVSITWLRPISTVTGILLLLTTAFDRYLWRLRILRGWLVKRPYIGGTWQVKLISNWVDPKTGNQIPPINGYMAVWQTHSSLNMRLITSESISELIGSEIILLKDGTFRVAAIYENEPKQMLRDRSPIHHGAILLQSTGPIPTSISGSYWTDRNTYGEIELRNRHTQTYPDFVTAAHAYTEYT